MPGQLVRFRRASADAGSVFAIDGIGVVGSNPAPLPLFLGSAKSFVDTNIVLYTIGKDARKADIVRALVAGQPAISSHVINECVSVCLRKPLFTREKAYAFGRTLAQ